MNHVERVAKSSEESKKTGRSNRCKRRRKTVSLTFSGFEMKSQDIASLFGGQALSYTHREVTANPNAQAANSTFCISMVFANGRQLDEMLSAFFEKYGGFGRFLEVRDLVKPKCIGINFDLPARASEYIQDGFLSNEDLLQILQLKAILSVSVF